MNAPCEQMELTLEATGRARRSAAPSPAALTPPRRSRRYTVSRWWFARMREAVREANEWSPADLQR